MHNILAFLKYPLSIYIHYLYIISFSVSLSLYLSSLFLDLTFSSSTILQPPTIIFSILQSWYSVWMLLARRVLSWEPRNVSSIDQSFIHSSIHPFIFPSIYSFEWYSDSFYSMISSFSDFVGAFADVTFDINARGDVSTYYISREWVSINQTTSVDPITINNSRSSSHNGNNNRYLYRPVIKSL